MTHVDEVTEAEFPAGAIENGRVLINRLENHYLFADEHNHGLAHCWDWQQLQRCFEHLAEYAAHRLASTTALQSKLEAAEAMAEAMKLIAIVDQGAGGNLTFKEMAESAMHQARTALAKWEATK